MKKIKDNLIVNNFSKSIFLLIVALYVFNSFKLNYYEVLFIDERLIVDDIYNVWLIDDVYNNFQNIENKILKNILVVLYEISYGGDLRYGRLWSNFFIIFSGPFSLISDTFLITFTRVLNILLFVFSISILTKTFINKKYRWIFMLSCLSIPGLEFLIRIPKPEFLSIFLISIGLYFLKEGKTYLSLFLFGLASFVKLNFILLYAIIFLFVLWSSAHKTKLIFKTILIFFGALIFVNPILIIPPLKIFQATMPNFYSEYFKWISSEGFKGQNKLFSVDFSIEWSKTLASFYKAPDSLYLLPTILLLLLILILFQYSLKNKEYLSTVFLSTSTLYLMFYFLFIERQFDFYLTLPFLILLVSFFMNIDYLLEQKKLKYILLIPFIVFFTIGIYSNLELNFKNKILSTSQELGYQNISDQEDAKLLINEVLNNIEMILSGDTSRDSYIVLWNPNLFMPRNGVTYNSNFYVRENWEHDNLDNILLRSQIFVTNQNFEQSGIKKTKFKNFYIYTK